MEEGEKNVSLKLKNWNELAAQNWGFFVSAEMTFCSMKNRPLQMKTARDVAQTTTH